MNAEDSRGYVVPAHAGALDGKLVTFLAREDVPPSQNIEDFIRVAREELTMFGSDLDWTHWKWKGAGMFMKQGAPRKIKAPGQWAMSPEFIDFAKALIRHEAGHHPSKFATQLRLAALRALEYALLQKKGYAMPADIDLGTFDDAAQALREYFGPDAAYNVGRKLQQIAKLLSRYGLTHNDTESWVSPIQAAFKMRMKLGVEADAHRRKKMPDLSALNGIGTVFAHGFDLSNNDTHADVYATSIVAMLMAQPSRIGEIHELTIDLEIEQPDLAGEMHYGFRYRSFKNIEATGIKWVPNNWVPIAKEAVRRIKEITKSARSFANYVEDQLEFKKKNPDATLRFYRHPACPDVDDDMPLDALQVADALGFLGKFPDSFLHSKGLTTRINTYTLDSLWQLVLQQLPASFPYIEGVKNTRLKYSEALFCMHAQQLKSHTRPNVLSVWAPTKGTFAPLLAKNPNVESFFERHRVLDGDGSPHRMGSHQIRHLLNTLGHEGTGSTFMSDAAINTWSGRGASWQGTTYNHVAPEEIARRIGNSLSKAGSRGVIDLPESGNVPVSMPHWVVTRSSPRSCADIEMNHRSAVLMTFWGSCEHDWLLEPCQFHKDCLNCQEHFCIKGFGADDQEKLQRLHQLQQKILHQQHLAELASNAGEYGASSYLSYQTAYRERVEQLIALLESADIPDGAKIRLASPPSNSHLHRVLKKIAIQELGDSVGQKDVLEALLLAYRENRALHLSDLPDPPKRGEVDA